MTNRHNWIKTCKHTQKPSLHLTCEGKWNSCKKSQQQKPLNFKHWLIERGLFSTTSNDFFFNQNLKLARICARAQCQVKFSGSQVEKISKDFVEKKKVSLCDPPPSSPAPAPSAYDFVTPIVRLISCDTWIYDNNNDVFFQMQQLFNTSVKRELTSKLTIVTVVTLTS